MQKWGCGEYQCLYTKHDTGRIEGELGLGLGSAEGQDAAGGCFLRTAAMHSRRNPAPVPHRPQALGWVLQPLWSLGLDSSQRESHRGAGMRRGITNCLEGHE